MTQKIGNLQTLEIPTDTTFNRLSDQLDNAHQFALSPNPAKEETTIKLSFDLIDDYYIEIMDIVGRVQDRIHIIKPQEQIISLSKFSSGNYVVNLLFDEKVIDSQKIIIIK